MLSTVSGARGRAGSKTVPALMGLQVESQGTDKRASKERKRDFPGGTVVRTHLPMQGTGVQSLVWEDPTCRGATEPVSHNY